MDYYPIKTTHATLAALNCNVNFRSNRLGMIDQKVAIAEKQFELANCIHLIAQSLYVDPEKALQILESRFAIGVHSNTYPLFNEGKLFFWLDEDNTSVAHDMNHLGEVKKLDGNIDLTINGSKSTFFAPEGLHSQMIAFAFEFLQTETLFYRQSLMGLEQRGGIILHAKSVFIPLDSINSKPTLKLNSLDNRLNAFKQRALIIHSKRGQRDNAIPAWMIRQTLEKLVAR